ncbi:MAG TPA: 3',5'-cyclic-nucleotide phosphodiesterase [Pyrinomonadaceae bacterium]|nr:3',5'-cyclic-nucleotide phosphodiesterase [Pyrinomonadaceae bacterium]
MKIQLLPSTFDNEGRATPEQRLSCYLIDDRVAVDAGSLALALNDAQRRTVRDIVVTHPHMDHVATLPIFIDDLFATLEEPVRVHATEDVISLLERDIFNWTLYPRFSELKNEKNTRVLEYVPFRAGEEFRAAHLRLRAVSVNHIVPTVGLVVTDGSAVVAFSSDTAATEEFWRVVNDLPRVDALLVESSFPNSMARLAEVSGHLTPEALRRELGKLSRNGFDILAVHLKPAYRETLVGELAALNHPDLSVMLPGREYEW